MKRIGALLLLLVMVCSFVCACGDDADQTSPSSTTSSSQTPSGGDDETAALKANTYTATITGSEKTAVTAEYRLIHKEGDNVASEAASVLYNAILDTTGMELTRRDSFVRPGSPYAESEYEILVGMVDNREATADALPMVADAENAVIGSYAIYVNGTKIAIIGEGTESLTRAVNTFIDLFVRDSGIEVYSSMTLHYVYDKASSDETTTLFYTPDTIRTVSSAAAFLLNDEAQIDCSPTTLSYSVDIPLGQDYPTISMTPSVADATMEVIQPNALNEGVGQVVVTAPDGVTKTTYTVHCTMLDYEPLTDASFTLAPNGAKSFLTLISDDGNYATPALMAPILAERGLKVELAMISNKLATITSATKGSDGKWTFTYTISAAQQAEIDRWKALFAQYPGVFGIACHSASHKTLGFDEKNLAIETIGAQYVLQQIFPEQDVLVWVGPGISSPTATEENYRAYELYVPGNFICARGATSGTFSNSMTKVGLETTESWISSQRDDMKQMQLWNLNTASLRNNTEAEGAAQYGYFKQLLNSVTNGSGWASLFWHEVYEGAGAGMNISKAFFTQVMDECVASIETGNVSNVFTHDAAAYIFERDDEGTVLTANRFADHIEVSVTDTLPDEMYHTPLTVKLYVTGEWTEATSLVVKDPEGKTVETVSLQRDKDGFFVYVNVTPDTGIYTITQAE